MINAIFPLPICSQNSKPISDIDGLEVELSRQFNGTGLVFLCERHAAKARTGGVGVGGGKARVVECVEGIHTKFKPDGLIETDNLTHTQIDLVHSVGTNVIPAGRIVPDKISEVLIDTVLIRVARSGLVIVTGKVLDTGPGRIIGDIGVWRETPQIESYQTIH
jgi:hypothetical protein